MNGINYPLLKEMIDCVAREVSFRFAVYPKRIQAGKMTKEQADREIHLMQMIKNALKKVYEGQAPETVQQAFLTLKNLITNLKNTGGKMLTFNLKKEWFEKIKSGEKTHEYRRMTPYWQTRINNALEKDEDFTLQCKFCCGYPNANDKEKILYADVLRIWSNVNGLETDLNIDEPVFDIEFELIKE